MKTVDLTGLRFGRLIALKPTNNRQTSGVIWECQCDCGELTTVTTGNLNGGRVKSCGCYRREAVNNPQYKHGYANTTTYKTWACMIQRCTNPSNKDFNDYGGRGIRVCERWEDFRNFVADMGEKPQGLTLDRIHNDGDYEPRNCQWATRKQQACNQRIRKDAVLLTIPGGGIPKTISQWSHLSCTPYGTIKERLRRGWSSQESIFGRSL